MDSVVKMVGISLVTAVFSLLVRQQQKPLAVLLSLIACMTILLLTIRVVYPIWDVIRDLKALSGVDDVMAAPVVKVAGIGLLTRLGAGICADSGESALGNTVEFSGSLLCVCASLPLLTAVMELVKEMISGGL